MRGGTAAVNPQSIPPGIHILSPKATGCSLFRSFFYSSSDQFSSIWLGASTKSRGHFASRVELPSPSEHSPCMMCPNSWKNFGREPREVRSKCECLPLLFLLLLSFSFLARTVTTSSWRRRDGVPSAFLSGRFACMQSTAA